jgi:hypothetical protein
VLTVLRTFYNVFVGLVLTLAFVHEGKNANKKQIKCFENVARFND